MDDQIFGLLGCSDGDTVDFVLALGKKKKDVEGLVGELEGLGVERSKKMETFAGELLEKMPKKKEVSGYKREEKGKVEMRRRNERYQIVGREEEEEVEREMKERRRRERRERKEKEGGEGEGREKKKRQLRKRKREEEEEEEEEEPPVEEKRRKTKEEEEEEEEERRVREDKKRAKDIAEYEHRLHERDKKNTKKVGSVASEVCLFVCFLLGKEDI